jgi:peptidoglycan/LPS O-acetylase OafA/YrhL
MQTPDRESSLALPPYQVLEATVLPRQARASDIRSHREAHAALQYRPDIDGLRGLAVGLVVAYHAFPELRTGGFIGVDVFFVISGYLITQLVLSGLQVGTFTLSEFYRRRVRRIAPALLVMLTACFFAGWLLLLPAELRWLGSSIKWCVPFLANVYFARTGGYFDRVAELNPLIHLWSLGVEEQFYLAWPVLLALAAKRGFTMRFMATVIATSLAYSIWSASHGTPHFYNPATRAWELAVGGILAAWQLVKARVVAHDVGKNSLSQLGAQASSLGGLVLIVVGGVCWTVDKGVPGIWSAIPTAGAALLIGAGPHMPTNRWFLASRPMIFIGKISYPLYLWHWPLFAFTRVVLGHRPLPGMAAVEIVIASLAAYVTYRLVESPIRHGELGRKAVRPLLAGLALLALAGAALDWRWIAGRLSGPVIVKWNEAVTDWHFPDEDLDPRTGFGKVTVASHRERKAVFIGDSHIQQYWPRVRRVIDVHPDSARSVVFATHLGCPPLPGIHSPWRDTNCGGSFDYAVQQAYRPDVDTVVFGAFWEYYFLGEYLPESSVPRVYGVPAIARAPLQLDSHSAQLALEQLQRAVSGLVSSGRRVFIILSNPTSPQFDPRFPPELRLALRLPRSMPKGAAPLVAAGPFESFVAPVTSRLRDIAAKSGARVVDPRSTLCDGMTCAAGDSNEMPLYLDSHHLNGANARERATFIDEMLLGPDAQAHE